MQNIPRDLVVVKNCFVPKLDEFLFADYNAIEMRLLAYYLYSSVKDESMIKEFAEGKDPHDETALSLNINRVMAKTINFAILYGGGATTVASILNITRERARKLIFEFNRARPGIKTLIKNLELILYHRGTGASLEEAQAERDTLSYWDWQAKLLNLNNKYYVITLGNRKLHPLEPRKVLNALIQGSAADILKTAMITVHNNLKDGGANSHIVLSIHDELILDIDLKEKQEIIKSLPEWMKYYGLKNIIDTPIEMYYSPTNWGHKMKIDLNLY